MQALFSVELLQYNVLKVLQKYSERTSQTMENSEVKCAIYVYPLMSAWLHLEINILFI